jgi:hypothetical protein
VIIFHGALLIDVPFVQLDFATPSNDLLNQEVGMLIQHINYKKNISTLSIFLSLLCLIFSYSTSFASEDNATQISTTNSSSKPPAIGNFMLPGSQAPGPLISITPIFLDKGITTLSLYVLHTTGQDQSFNGLLPEIAYGITDNLSILIAAPYAISSQYNQARSSGAGDALFELDYTLYSKTTSQYAEAVKLISGFTLPTGSSSVQPATGFGAPSYIINLTYNRYYTAWFGFASGGIQYPSTHNGSKFGNIALYQGGFGRNIMNIDSKWSLAWVLEADGTYTSQSRINGMTVNNTGSNIITITPSISIASKYLFIQAGITKPIISNLYGHQNKQGYAVTAEFSYTIY